MKTNTLVVVQAFAPYADMVRGMMPYWKWHGFPVVVTSPTDSRCEVKEADCVFHGLNGYVGPVSLDRWRIMLQWMAEQPFDYFLMHESDSVCLDPIIPSYCYDRPGILTSNEMPDNGIPATQRFYCVAPWFMSKSVIVRMLEVAKTSPDRPPYHGDRWVGQMVEEGAIGHRPFSPGIGCGTLKPDTAEFHQVCRAVQEGACMIHGVKSPRVLFDLLSNYRR